MLGLEKSLRDNVFQPFLQADKLLLFSGEKWSPEKLNDLFKLVKVRLGNEPQMKESENPSTQKL